MNIRSKGISAAVTVALTGTLCGVGASAAQARTQAETRPQPQAQTQSQAQSKVGTAAGADEICAVLGIGSGAAGLTKALAKGASWVGIGASVGCYAYTKAKEATPAERRAAMLKSYKKYHAMSPLKRLDALGYYCRKKDGGGGGGTDFAPANKTMIGWRDIKMNGVTYTCTATRD